MFGALSSQILKIGKGLVSKSATFAESFVRTRTTCSRNGKEKSVKTAMHRYFRINKRIWIRAIPGFQNHLYKKTAEEKFILQQPVIVSKKESRMVERMSGPYFKKLKIQNFTHGPFVAYRTILNRTKYNYAEKNEGQSFFP